MNHVYVTCDTGKNSRYVPQMDKFDNIIRGKAYTHDFCWPVSNHILANWYNNIYSILTIITHSQAFTGINLLKDVETPPLL